MRSGDLDPDTEHAARAFVEKAGRRYDLLGAIVFGSRARHEHRPDSDTDLAVLLQGNSGPRFDTALILADIAFDVLLETGILIEAIPFWEDEWQHPEQFGNPSLIENIRQDGVLI